MPETTSHQLVVFSLGSEEYALPIGAVHEIIRYTEPRSVASEVPWIRGVIGLRGKIIPIFDLAARLGLDAAAEPAGKIVIVESGAGQVGVIVDEVEEVLTVDDDAARGRPDRQQRVDRGRSPRSTTASSSCSTPTGLFAREAAEELAAAAVAHGRARSRTPGSASSSPTTPASCAGCSPTPSRRQGFDVVGHRGRRRRGARRLPRRTAPTR